MDRRTFLRTTGLAGIAGLAGCSTPFDPVSTPEPSNGSGSNTSANADGAPTEGSTATATSELTETPAAPQTRSGAALTGVYPGNENLNRVLSDYSNWLSKNPAVVLLFVDALADPSDTRGFVDTALTQIWNAGHVPMISWQPLLGRSNQTPERVERLIANGEYDERLETWATALDDWARPRGENTRGRRFYFRPAHEMNGNWFPWSAVDSTRIPASTDSPGTAEDYVSMWRYVHDLFADTEMDETNIQWVWSPNADEQGGVRAERYYPGDQYVDWIGLDGFNFGGSQTYENGSTSDWRSPNGIFGSMLGRIRDLTDKPVALTEFASSSVPESGNGNQPQQKAEWIEDVFEFVVDNDIKMTCWFDADQEGADESDWAVFGGSRGTSQVTIDGTQYAVYEAFNQAVSGSDYLGARPDYPPLLTDDEFAGTF